LRLSIIMEWANTRLNGVPRAWDALQSLARQWREVLGRRYPATLPPTAASFLDGIDRRAELLIVSGDGLAQVEEEIRARAAPPFDVELLVAPGLEYYALKNHGARRARGDLLLFVDSDVVPDDGWLAHLLGSFGQPGVDVVCSQVYVAPTDLFARAFALAWTYSLRDESGGLTARPGKFYANSMAFRAEVFRRAGFPPVGARSRGSAALLRQELARLGITVWENRSACVDHPPPSSLRHLAVRALAHGRDHYMHRSEERHLYGLLRSVGLAAGRLARGVHRTIRDGRRVGLRPWELPAALALCSTYYGFFALGGVLTHVSPRAMSRRFRV
jgi:glycosyltransferase involved in cell wall biosynthesis